MKYSKVEFLNLVKKFFPNAIITSDFEGQIVIYTDLMEKGDFVVPFIPEATEIDGD